MVEQPIFTRNPFEAPRTRISREALLKALLAVTALYALIGLAVHNARFKSIILPTAPWIPTTVVETFRLTDPPPPERAAGSASPTPVTPTPVQIRPPEQTFDSDVEPLALNATTDADATVTNSPPTTAASTAPSGTSTPSVAPPSGPIGNGGTAAAPPVAAPPFLTRVQWLSKPTSEDLIDFYPQRAYRLEIAGRAVLNCTVAVNGTVQNCLIESETPKSYGFGEAALKASRLFRMKPATSDGVSTAGGKVRIPLEFNLE